ncbi:MAG: GNAT family N-acetyltransferase [Anaerolineaceae bacterium]|nr:GNAT family N-acetyltransferase [Anaerolineaceae bacterium]
MKIEKSVRPDSQSQIWINNVIVRHLIFSDLPQLEWDGEYSHLRQVYLNAYKKRNEGKYILWVADLPKSGIIGQVFIQLNSTRKDLADGYFCAYLFAFRIKADFRNAGLGTRMLSVVETDLVKRNYGEITLNVAKTNDIAIRFYNRLGFEIIGSESGEWSFRDQNNKLQHVKEPALKMIKTINNSH